MIQDKLKISIITPNYNYAKYIGKAVESVVSQDYADIEHIIIDDGSTDNSVEEIEKIDKEYPGRIKLIKQKNTGQTKALNVALSHVTGDIIGWLNSDDYFLPGTFSKIIELFINNPELDAVFGDINIVDNEDNFVKKIHYYPFCYASSVFIGFGKEISSNAIFWKKELTDQVQGFDENFNTTMDSEYWSRLLYKRKLKHINLALASFRWHENAKTIKRRDRNSKNYHTANKEENLIKRNSYKNLLISKILPLKFTFPIYVLFKVRRHTYKYLSKF